MKCLQIKKIINLQIYFPAYEPFSKNLLTRILKLAEYEELKVLLRTLGNILRELNGNRKTALFVLKNNCSTFFIYFSNSGSVSYWIAINFCMINPLALEYRKKVLNLFCQFLNKITKF